jgi:hypothetical protein
MFYASTSNSSLYLSTILTFPGSTIRTPQASAATVDLSQDVSALMSLLSQPSAESKQERKSNTVWEDDKHAVSDVLTWMSDSWQSWEQQFLSGETDLEAESILPIPGWSVITGTALPSDDSVDIVDDAIAEEMDDDDDDDMDYD